MSHEGILTILEDMGRTGRAAPVDKSKNVWEVYWHSLDEWGNLVYNWACNSGMNNSVCTLFELREGENTVDQGKLFLYKFYCNYFDENLRENILKAIQCLLFT